MGAAVLIAGGGTVGHLAPGFAVRDALREAGVTTAFVTPGEERERGWFPEGEPEPFHVAAPRLPRGILTAIAFPFRMGRALRRARRLVATEKPRVVLALGGWPCAPAAIAAIDGRIPLHLLATDAVPGLVVRKLAKRAARIYVTSAEARAALPDAGNVLLVGPLVRRAVAGARRDPARFGLDPSRVTLLIVGGSLGAKGLNERAREGLRTAVGSDPTHRDRIQVVHSTGTEEEAEASRALYERLGLAHHAVPFLRDIGTALATADLVLCRGGAGTLAEVVTLGRPAIVVPYPHHADRQQWSNARPLVEAGRAVLVEEADLTPSRFRDEVLGRLLDPGALAAMARPPAAPSGEDPAGVIARELVRSIGAAT